MGCYNNYRLITFTFESKLHGQWGPELRRSVRRVWTKLPRNSHWLLDVLLGSWVFLALRWTTIEKVLGVGAVWRWLFLTVKPSHAGVNVDVLSCPLHQPTAYGCRPRVLSSWFETMLPYLVAKPFLREPLSQQAHLLWLSGWGPEPLGWRCLVLITPRGTVPDSHSLSGDERPLRRLTLLSWRRFESSVASSW
jgi:hypothetical protein